MNGSSNQNVYAVKVFTLNFTKLASGLAANSYTLVTTAGANASVVKDILFRSLDATARLFNIIICPTGSSTTDYYSIVQVSIPANSGNNGTTTIASLAALAPSLFDIDMAGNRALGLESTMSIYVQNTTALAGDFHVMVRQGDF